MCPTQIMSNAGLDSKKFYMLDNLKNFEDLVWKGTKVVEGNVDWFDSQKSICTS